MIPLSTLITRVRTRYEAESGGSTIRWSDARITDYINEGLECLAEASKFYERYCTIGIEEGRTYYDLRGFAPETVTSISSIWSTSRLQWLNETTLTRLDNAWQMATGDPESYFTRGIYWLVVYPKPAATTGYLRVYFKGIPPRFSFPQAVLGELPADHFPALEDYTLYEMAASDGQPKRALTHWGSYAKREKSLQDAVSRRLTPSTTGRIGGMAR